VQSVWKASRAKSSVPRHDRALRAGNTALGIGPEIPTPNPTADGRGSSLIVKHPHPLNTLMAFFGLRKWPTPVSARLCDVDYASWSLAQFAFLILTLFPFFSHRCSGRCGLSLQLAASLTSSSPRRKTSRFAVSYFTRPKPVRKLSQLILVLFFHPPFSRGFPQ
jgi:hypothetical protein